MALRVVGWVFAPYTMAFLDPSTRSMYTSAVVGAVTTVLTMNPVLGGMAAGASGAYMNQLDGKKGNIIKSGLAGGASATVGWGMADFGPVIAGAAAGATNAGIQGGDPGRGALFGAGSGLAMSVVQGTIRAEQQHRLMMEYLEKNPMALAQPFDAQLSIQVGTETHNWSIFGLKHTVESTLPPNFGAGVQLSFNEPSPDLSAVSAEFGLSRHLSVGTNFFYNPHFDGSNQMYLHQGMNINLGWDYLKTIGSFHQAPQ